MRNLAARNRYQVVRAVQLIGNRHRGTLPSKEGEFGAAEAVGEIVNQFDRFRIVRPVHAFAAAVAKQAQMLRLIRFGKTSLKGIGTVRRGNAVGIRHKPAVFTGKRIGEIGRSRQSGFSRIAFLDAQLAQSQTPIVIFVPIVRIEAHELQLQIPHICRKLAAVDAVVHPIARVRFSDIIGVILIPLVSIAQARKTLPFAVLGRGDIHPKFIVAVRPSPIPIAEAGICNGIHTVGEFVYDRQRMSTLFEKSRGLSGNRIAVVIVFLTGIQTARVAGRIQHIVHRHIFGKLPAGKVTDFIANHMRILQEIHRLELLDKIKVGIRIVDGDILIVCHCQFFEPTFPVAVTSALNRDL